MLADLNKLRLLFNRRDKLHFAGLLGLMVVGAALDAVGVGAVPAFVATLAMSDKVMQHPTARPVLEWLQIDSARELVLWGCGGLLLVFMLKNAFLGVLYYAQARTTEAYRVKLADRLFTAYMHAPFEFHLSRNTAELWRNVNAETKEILAGVLQPLLTGIEAFLMTVFIVAVLVIATPGYAMVAVLIVGGGSFFFVRAFKKRLKEVGQEAQHERRQSVQAVVQGLNGIVDARIMRREPYFIEVFRTSLRQFARANRTNQIIGKLGTPVLETVAVTGLLVIVMFSALTSDDLVALIPIMALLGAAIVRLRATVSIAVASISRIRFSIHSINPVVDDLRYLKQITSTPYGRSAGKPVRCRFEEAITFEGVEFTYTGSLEPAVSGLNLAITKGTSVALVGSTGSGKSTIISLLLGLLEPQRGCIHVDGRDIREDMRGWYGHVGYVPQHIYLLDDTIRRNIAFGIADEEIEEDRLWNSVRAAQLEEYVLALPDGIDTVVGERGVRLSGGQRQRIGLARALYDSPDVLILDEATSALDGITEEAVMQAIERMGPGITTIMIAHRLATVKDCDRIFMLDHGKVVAQGTYAELVEENVTFRGMARLAS